MIKFTPYGCWLNFLWNKSSLRTLEIVCASFSHCVRGIGLNNWLSIQRNKNTGPISMEVTSFCIFKILQQRTAKFQNCKLTTRLISSRMRPDLFILPNKMPKKQPRINQRSKKHTLCCGNLTRLMIMIMSTPQSPEVLLLIDYFCCHQIIRRQAQTQAKKEPVVTSFQTVLGAVSSS